MEKDLWKQLKLYALTDLRFVQDNPSKTMADLVREAIAQGATMIQLREKRLNGAALEEEARQVLAVCQESGIPLIINDDLELALKIHADGVHLGQKDGSCKAARSIAGEDFIIGVTAPSVVLARQAERDGADYIGAGAVYPTQTKTDTKPLTPQALREITKAISIPAVAIGGLAKNNVDVLKDTGIAGFASSSGVFAHLDDQTTVPSFLKKAQEICVNA